MKCVKACRPPSPPLHRVVPPPPHCPPSDPLPIFTPQLRARIERAIVSRNTSSLRDSDPSWDTLVGRALERWPGDDVYNDLRVMRGHGRVAGWDRRRAEIVVPTLDPSLPRPVALRPLSWPQPPPAPLPPFPAPLQPPPSMPPPPVSALSPPSHQPPAPPISRFARASASALALAHSARLSLGNMVRLGSLSLGRIAPFMGASGRSPHPPSQSVRQNK